MPATVIIGAGIIGTSTAFFQSELSRAEAGNIHLVDASSELFYCSSGLAGGFMAKDCGLRQIRVSDRTEPLTGGRVRSIRGLAWQTLVRPA
jgi:glycine/D-amino acid oxidase-like deaminating enzyme